MGNGEFASGIPRCSPPGSSSPPGRREPCVFSTSRGWRACAAMQRSRRSAECGRSRQASIHRPGGRRAVGVARSSGLWAVVFCEEVKVPGTVGLIADQVQMRALGLWAQQSGTHVGNSAGTSIHPPDWRPRRSRIARIRIRGRTDPGLDVTRMSLLPAKATRRAAARSADPAPAAAPPPWRARSCRCAPSCCCRRAGQARSPRPARGSRRPTS